MASAGLNKPEMQMSTCRYLKKTGSNFAWTGN